MNKQQPDALRLAAMLTADEWPGSVTLVSYARECVAELLRQHARITALESQLAQRFDAADMATAAAQGFQDGGASLSANAGEPFGWVKQSEIDSSKQLGGSINLWRKRYDCDVPIYLAAPPTAQAGGWVSVEERLPAKNTEVLICFAESTLPSTGQYTGHAADPAGWCYPKESYLWPGESEKLPDGGAPTVTHWMPLPPLPHQPRVEHG